MNTSYFSKYKGENAVCIAARAPKGFKGRHYPALAPKWWFYKKFKEDGDEVAYIRAYQEEVLRILSPYGVFEELGADAVLICWEGKGKFCHRHIVADWLEKALGIEILEL